MCGGAGTEGYGPAAKAHLRNQRAGARSAKKQHDSEQKPLHTCSRALPRNLVMQGVSRRADEGYPITSVKD